MTLFFCREKLAARVIRTLRVKISPASAPILVRVFSAHSVADATEAEIAADSADVVGARMGVPIVHIAEATVTVVAIGARIGARIAARIAARIVAVIAAGGVSSAVLVAMARIADTLLRAGLN